MSALALREINVGLPSQSGKGFGYESEKIDELYEDAIRNLKETETIGRYSVLNKILDVLEELYNNCYQDNWDGYNAKPISFETYLQATYIIHMLNTSLSNFHMPDIIPEPDGDIAFEWTDDLGHTFAFSIDDNKTINYAGIFGPNKVHGTEIFRDFIPSAVINNLYRLSL